MATEIDFRGSFCTETKRDPVGLVIFGASGDLTQRKLLPALFSLFDKGLLVKNSYIIGVARTQMTDEAFRQRVRESLKGHSKEAESSNLDEFVSRCGYLAGEYHDAGLYSSLSSRLKQMDAMHSTGGNRIFYFATPPNLPCPVAGRLASAGLTRGPDDGSAYVRVVIEKPFGWDLESAKELDIELHRHLNEDQIYRIDHYLGKDTVQNILMFRFANTVFEPVWNNRYIDHVQVTVAGSIGVEHRAGYFEQAGLLRDMFQNHLLQMVALVAMETPVSFEADRVRDEKVKVMRSIRPFPLNELGRWIVRGQYGSGQVNGQDVPGYRGEDGVSARSQVETFVAAKIMIDNWRWQGVPFYLRSGKRMAKDTSEIVITFRKVPHSIFSPLMPAELTPNVLVLTVQPNEGVSLTIQAKVPGPKICLASLAMNFCYSEVFGVAPPNAYERLLLDCMLGDQTLFWRSDGIEVSWSIFTPVLEKWERDPEECPLYPYWAGTWGPGEAETLLERDGREWRMP